MNRIAFAWSSGALWGNRFTIDIWGNLNKKDACQTGDPCAGKPLGEYLNQSADANNRFVGMTYDSAGNLINDGTGNTYTYDAENRISTTAGVSYTYDGDGERVKKSSGTLYWGLASNEPLAESDTSGNISKEFIFFGGKRIARLDLPGGAVHYYFSDHLGSSNVVTNATGATIEQESDFYPFGGERTITDLLPDQRYKFTGKERDPESGLDYFGARYYSSSLGRFITPDWAAAPTAVPYAEFGNPQSLNLYGYVRNNPLSRADDDGHCPAGDCPINLPKTLADLDRQSQANQDYAIGVGKGVVNFSTSMMNVFLSMGQSTSAPIPQFEPSNDIQALGMVGGTVLGAVASALGEAPAASTIQQNAAKGAAFEKAIKPVLESEQTGVVQNLTVKTESGVKTTVDFAGRESGQVVLTEAKSSATARLTKNQAKAFPEIKQTGCTVCGKGKPGFPGGTKIPPTKVKVVRPD